MRQPAGRRHHLVPPCANGSGEQVQDRIALGRSWVGRLVGSLDVLGLGHGWSPDMEQALHLLPPLSAPPVSRPGACGHRFSGPVTMTNALNFRDVEWIVNLAAQICDL